MLIFSLPITLDDQFYGAELMDVASTKEIISKPWTLDFEKLP